MSNAKFDALNVSRETMDRLEQFVDLVKKWTKAINLIAPGTVGDIWTRHIVDSAQVYHLAPDHWKTWTDIGSGGGFPGLVVAILDQKERQITLIESDQRKCLFLKTVKRELGLNVSVEQVRIERAEVEPADIVSARALSALPSLLGACDQLLKHTGTAIFPKGGTFQEELDQARLHWQFDVVEHQSQTHQDGRVLEISRIQRREP